jgi:nucleoside phosphorylase
VAGEPHIFLGPIVSSNTLLKDWALHDMLRNRFGVKAVKMEAASVADAAWEPQVGYLVIRGVSDYCDPGKNDRWQQYAAIVAAAYTRALLALL